MAEPKGPITATTTNRVEVEDFLTINLSSHPLTPDDLKLLEKGLSFIPTPKTLPISTILADKNRLIRSIKLKYFFKDKENKNNYDVKDKKFIEKSTWTPMNKQLPTEALTTIYKLDEFFTSEVSKRRKKQAADGNEVIKLFAKDNLTKGESGSLASLKKLDNIIIKPADKGGATVIMDKNHYVIEAQRQLSDTKYYRKLTKPINENNIPKIKTILQGLLDEKFISQKQLQYLSGPAEFKTRTFYLLPKIHKSRETWTLPHKMPQGRPIVSDVNSESYRVSEYIDYFLNPLASRHKSYIKNTYDFITRVRGKNIPKHHLIVTGDVTSLYTNMDINRTIECTKQILANAPFDPKRPDEGLIKLLDLTMKNNDFEFDNEFFLQTCGTAMGKKYAPSLANIYLLEFDDKAMNDFKIKPDNYGRYLDDVFFTWAGTVSELKEYEAFLNSLIPGIKITLEYSLEEMNFLDTTIYKIPRVGDLDLCTLQTRIFFKPTDTHQLLHVASHHPKHTTRGIIKSQLIRFKRISSNKRDYDNTCKILFKYLKNRGYKYTNLKTSQQEIWFNYQEREKNGGDSRTNQQLLPIININNDVGVALTRGYKNIIGEDPFLTDFKLIAAYKNPKNLRQHLVRSKINTDTNLENNHSTQNLGYTQCNSIRCKTCRIHATSSKSFTSSHNQSRHQITHTLTCTTTNIIYLITCNRCNKQYVGETGRSLAQRLTDHRSNIKNHKPTPIALHFNSSHHNLHDLKAIAIAKIADNDRATAIRKRHEQNWQHRLGTKDPWGLNELHADLNELRG